MNYDTVDEEFTKNLQQQIELSSNFLQAPVRENNPLSLFTMIYVNQVGNDDHTVQSLQSILQQDNNIQHVWLRLQKKAWSKK